MRPRPLLMFALAALLVAAGGVAYTQNKPVKPAPPPEYAPPDPGTSAGFSFQGSPQGGYSQLQAAVPTSPPKPADRSSAEKSIDQLLDRLEAIQEQKADLEKQEQVILKEVRRRMEKQADRLDRLGITPPAVPAYGSLRGASFCAPAPVYNRATGTPSGPPAPAAHPDLPPEPYAR